MKHIYEDLENHQSVEEFEDVRGIKHNMFFIDHRHKETTSDDLRTSYTNEYEVKFLTRLCHFILQQGYDSSNITILTPYVGQMFALREGLCEDGGRLSDVRISTIDNFQGEENDIILLSLVRSNQDNRAGFVNDNNRACVALSRARKGLYVIGNFECVTSKSKIWTAVVEDVKEQGCFGRVLPLACQRHANTEILIEEPDDFLKKVPQGGCDLPCQCRISCGHTCTWSCHPDVTVHSKCIEQCEHPIISCEYGHVCPNRCGEDCVTTCNKRIEKQLPCGHTKPNVRCATRTQDITCVERCEKMLSCGHQCQAHCGERCTRDCMELVKHTDWPCGHVVTAACSATPLDCKVPCGMLSCEHECSGKCGECLQGRVHKRCTKTCGRTLVCSHQCQSICSIACPPCRKDCKTACSHSKCRNKCGELCVPCKYSCEWQCKHFECSRKCGEMCDRPRCNEPCKRIIPGCGHKCRGLCDERCICIKCQEIEEIFGTEDDLNVRFLRLKDCEHIFEVSGLDRWMDQTDTSEEDNGIEAIQLKGCPVCRTPVQRTTRYNNVTKQHLLDIEKVKKAILEKHKPTSSRNTLVKKVSSYKGSVPEKYNRHKKECEQLVKRIDSTTNSHDRVVLENQVNLLTRCQELITKLEKATPSEFKKDIDDKFLPIITVVKYLATKRIIGCRVQREIDDINVEITRQNLCFLVYNLGFEIKSNQNHNPTSIQPEHQQLLDNIASKMSRGEKMEENELEAHIKEVEEAGIIYLLNPPTREEKAAIVKAMGLSKGHWFKCPQGHIYAIGECGGAMQRGICPECKADIGGTQHKLDEGNTLAAEMDGAQFAAWSEQANMGNYEIIDEV